MFMQVFSVNIPIYANNETEANNFAKEFYGFVASKREQGIAVSADKMIQAINQFKNNPFLNNFLR